MNLFETTQTIKGWIRSCEKADQLDLCEEIVKEYVGKRFEDKIELIALAHALSDLKTEINLRRLLVASTPTGTNKREPNITDIS